MAKLSREVEKVFKDIRSDIHKAKGAAIGRAAQTAISETSKSIRQGYTIKAKDIKQSMRLRKTKEAAYLKIREYSLALSKYGSPRGTARPRKYKTGKYGGVKVTVKKGSRKLRHKAFIASMRSGHTGIFVRSKKFTKNNKQKLLQLYGPSAFMLITDTHSMNVMQRAYELAYEKRYTHEINRRFR